jgi:hypothetical protein
VSNEDMRIDALDANRKMDDKTNGGSTTTSIPPNVEITNLRQVGDEVWNDDRI